MSRKYYVLLFCLIFASAGLMFGTENIFGLFAGSFLSIGTVILFSNLDKKKNQEKIEN